MSIYRDDRAFDLYIQAALEEECDSSDEDLNELTREIERLRAALAEAIEEVESWAAYASEYFQEKHDLQGTLKRLRGVLQK